MSDYFAHLADRVHAPERVLQPRVGGLFENVAGSALAEQAPEMLAPSSSSIAGVTRLPGAPDLSSLVAEPHLSALDREPREERIETTAHAETGDRRIAEERALTGETRIAIGETSPDMPALTAGVPPFAFRATSPTPHPDTSPEPSRVASTAEPTEMTPTLLAPRAPFAPRRRYDVMPHPEHAPRHAPRENEVAAAEPDVHITIGRIDVRAVTQTPRERSRSASPRALTLDEVLAQRGRQ